MPLELFNSQSVEWILQMSPSQCLTVVLIPDVNYSHPISPEFVKP